MTKQVIKKLRRLIVEQTSSGFKASEIVRLILQSPSQELHKIDQIKLVMETLDVGMRAGSRLAGWQELGGTLSDNKFDDLMHDIVGTAIQRLQGHE